MCSDRFFATYLQDTTLDVVSKPRIRPESKAQPDEKAQHTRAYVSILKRAATQLSGLGWGFETASKQSDGLKDDYTIERLNVKKVDSRNYLLPLGDPRDGL